MTSAVPPSEKFKINLLEMLEDLKEEFENDQKLKNSLELLLGFAREIASEKLISYFIDTLDKERLDGSLRQKYLDGNYYFVLSVFISELPLAETLGLTKLDIKTLDEDSQSIYIEYLQSFYRISSSYKKTEV